MTDEHFDNIFPFDSPREYQREVIEAAINAYDSGKRFVLLGLPTAVGKSGIAVALSRHYGQSYVLTSQKVLQDQYVKDFEKIGLSTVKGRANYRCARDPKLKCDMGVCKRTKAKRPGCGASMCPYLDARIRTYGSPIACLNYTYFLNMVKAPESPQEPRDLLVLDECHNTEKNLISFASLSLDRGDFKKFEVKFSRFPRENESDDDKIEWLNGRFRSEISAMYARELAEFNDMDPNDRRYYTQSRKTKYLDTLICMLNRMMAIYEKGVPIVVVQDKDYRMNFRLLAGGDFAHEYLYDFGERVLMMSATIFDKQQFCRDHGLDPDEVAFFTCDSPIPSDNRKVYGLQNVSLSYKNIERNLPKLVVSVKKILDGHQGKRGIIHTVNYRIANAIFEAIGGERLVFPKGNKRDAELQRFFRSSRDDLVLLSPALAEGISLDDDHSRFSIVCKLPYMSLGDPWVRLRMELDGGWYTTQTVQTIVQMTGRSVRSMDDHAISYVLDADFGRFYHTNERRFPKWWKKSVKFPRR